MTDAVCKSSIQICKTLFSATTLGRLCKLDPSFFTTLLLVTIQLVWLALSTDLAQHYQLVDFNCTGAVGHGSRPATRTPEVALQSLPFVIAVPSSELQSLQIVVV